MTTTDVDVNNVLLNELRNMYPEVPERIVTSHMIKHKNDRAKVIEVLDHEGSQYLFERPLYDPIQRRMENLTISHTEGRTRSDSGSSGVSSTSTNSVSSVSSVPYGGGNSRPPPPPDGTEFSQFMSPIARSTNIPNINCNVFTPSSPPVSTPMALGKVNKPLSKLQPIQVLHVQTSQGQSPTTRSDHNSPPPRVLIQVNPRSTNHNAQTNQYQHHYKQQLSYPSTNTTPHKWHTQQSVPGNNYNTYTPQGHNYPNMAGGLSPGIHTVERQPYRKPPVSPQPPESVKPSQSHISFPSQYGGPSQQSQWNTGTSSSSSGSHSGQQLSQATIFLDGANKHGGHGAMYNSGTSSGTHYNHPISTANIHGSHSEPYLLGVYSPSQHQQPQTPQVGSNTTKPLFIKVSSLTNQEGGSPSQYRYQPDLQSSTGSMNTHQVNARYGNISGDIPRRTTGTVHPSSYVGQLYLNNEVVNTTGNGSSSHGGETGSLFMHYPQVPTTCRVPGHPSSSGSSSPPVLPARTGIPPSQVGIPSSVSENVINRKIMESGESQHISHATFQPLVSPASSQSSLSSESSSQREIQRPRSGSVQEEADYISALLLFQKERMSKLKQDLESELRKLAKIRNEVTQMEKNMLDRTRTRNLNFSPHLQLEDVARLRGHNMKLQAEIQVMTREVDMYNNGQTPLGVLDPLEQQNFFQNMNPGQRGSIYSRPPAPTPTPPSTSETPPPIPPRIHHVPPPPPPQPLTGSGDMDGDGEQWNCSACTFLNHPALNKCECCEMPRMNAPPPTTDLFDEYDDGRHNELNDAGNDFELV